MEGMQSLLNLYTNMNLKTYDQWGSSTMQAAILVGRGKHCMGVLCQLTCQFINDRTVLLVNPYGDWNTSMLVDEDLTSDINLHLQELGKEISAQKLVHFLARDEVKQKYGISWPISERTAQHYLKALGYWFMAPKKGQYSDGHERKDVVWYRDTVFLPRWREIQPQMENWM
jgi:hypothetical protein